MGTDDIGVAVEGLMAYLNTVRALIRNETYVAQGSSIRVALAACQTTVAALLSNSDEEAAIVAALGALTTTVTGIVDKPASDSAIVAAIADYLTALDAILNPS